MGILAASSFPGGMSISETRALVSFFGVGNILSFPLVLWAENVEELAVWISSVLFYPSRTYLVLFFVF